MCSVHRDAEWAFTRTAGSHDSQTKCRKFTHTRTHSHTYTHNHIVIFTHHCTHMQHTPSNRSIPSASSIIQYLRNSINIDTHTTTIRRSSTRGLINLLRRGARQSSIARVIINGNWPACLRAHSTHTRTHARPHSCADASANKPICNYAAPLRAIRPARNQFYITKDAWHSHMCGHNVTRTHTHTHIVAHAHNYLLAPIRIAKVHTFRLGALFFRLERRRPATAMAYDCNCNAMTRASRRGCSYAITSHLEDGTSQVF